MTPCLKDSESMVSPPPLEPVCRLYYRLCVFVFVYLGRMFTYLHNTYAVFTQGIARCRDSRAGQIAKCKDRGAGAITRCKNSKVSKV